MTLPRRTTQVRTRAVLVASLVATLLAGCDDAGSSAESDGDAQSQAKPDAGKTDAGKAASDAGRTGGDAAISKSGSCTSSSTYEAIQKSIFEGKSRTTAACHGADTKSLNLAGPGAYANLINKPAKASLAPPMNLVTPGEQALSFLYLKLAAATDPAMKLPAGGGAPMPTGTAPLTKNQLEAVRLWIRGGAPEKGVVEGTQALLSCTQPTDATANKSARPPVPAPSEGFQHMSGPWVVPPNAEDEICFATYYDLSKTAPADARVPCNIGGIDQECVTYNRRELSQDAQSHHSIINVYGGAVPPTDPIWGQWQCAGGDLEGTPCDPTKSGVAAKQGGAECGDKGICQAPPKKGTCSQFGPTDKEMTKSTVGAGGSQAPVSADRFPEGVYSQIPIKGVVLWNSHGFNLTKAEANIEQYNSFWYARPDERKFRMNGIFTSGKNGLYSLTGTGAVSQIKVLPFQTQEICETYTLPQYARLSELSAHAHKRAIEWRTWLPPNVVRCETSGSCKPRTETPEYRSVSYNDPVVLAFDPPLKFDQADEASRTLLFCGTYDNGKKDPKLLKQKSKLIQGSDCVSSFPPREETLYCVGGDKQGAVCKANADCGTGGSCDACNVEWGERTEDEMFFLMGQFYVEPPATP